MGVGGSFWDLLKPYACHEDAGYLRGRRVAVDLSFWVVSHSTAIWARSPRARHPHLRTTFFRTLSLFSKMGAFPVFVVDGEPSPLKAQARAARFFRGSGMDLAALPSTEVEGEASVAATVKGRNAAFTRYVEECVELLEYLGMPVLRANGEAEALCAQLNNEGHVDACITSDSDALLFGAKTVIKVLRSNCKEPFECYNVADIEAGLGLKRKQMKFMGKSENGMNSLETRVHGLEMALDEISRDLAVSSGRMSNRKPDVKTCCILSPKFWRSRDGSRHSSRFSVSDAPNSSEESRTSYKWERQKFGLQGGFVTNPLAEPNILSVGRTVVTQEGRRKDLTLQKSRIYADESALIPQNTTVLIRRTAGQLSEKIVLFSSRKVVEDGSIASNKSVVTESISKSCSSTEVQDEDAAIAAVIDASELKWEEQPSKRGHAGGRFTSGRHYGHGPLEGEAPPPGYVCHSCGVPGHFIQHCPQEIKTPPPGYVCYRCRIPGHFIHHCPTFGDPKFDNYKMSRSLAPVVSASPVDGISSELAPAASVSVVDDLPAELHCRLCNKVITDAVLTSKCCFDSFCDQCIRHYIITQTKCICGVKVLADDLIPNHTLRSTISNMLATRACSTTSGTGKHKSSSGSNPDPKSQSHTPSTALERDMKQSMDDQLSSATPDYGLQVATEDDVVNRPQENLAMNVDLKSKGNSAEWSVEKVVPSADVLNLKDGSESTLKHTTISGTLEPKAARTDKLKKRKKSDSTKIVHPDIADYGHSTPLDPAYYSLFNSGYPWVTEPYMYGSLGMPYGCYPIGPYGVNSISNMPPQTLAMQGYPANYPSWETQSTLHRDAEAAARSRQSERPKGFSLVLRSSERNHHLGSHGTESRSRSRSRPERRDQRSDRASNDYDEDHHSRKRVRVSSPMDGDKQSGRRSRHTSRSLTRDDSSDDERNFKRRWGCRSSITSDTKF